MTTAAAVAAVVAVAGIVLSGSATTSGPPEITNVK